MNNLTQEDLKNILALINNAPIKGGESLIVAALVQKLTSMLAPTLTTEKESSSE